MKSIAIYLRLSKEDEFTKDESNSIANQRSVILSHIRSHKEFYGMDVKEYSDDGYTGKNMNRPGMESLLKAVKDGCISCVIVKDLSRFSRDHIVLSQYMELIFPFMNIRFISLGDNYDSDKCEGGIGELDIAFKSLIYDFYSEDISIKVRSSLQVQRANGNYIATMAPYGYFKDPEDHHKLIIDPEAAGVVTRIFKEYKEGSSMYGISNGLNADNITPPAIYIQKRDGKSYGWRKLNKFWSTTMVSKILHKEIYKGTMTYGKAKSTEVGSKTKYSIPKEEWKRVENTIPPIISEELFEEVERKLGKNKPVKRRYEEHILRGKVYCGGCDNAMIHSNAGRPKYECHYRYRDNTKGCITSIRDEDLEKIILSLIQEKVQDIKETSSILEEKNEERQQKIKTAYKNLDKMQETLKRLEDDLMESYEAYKEGFIDRTTYLQQKELSDDMKIKLSENIEKQEGACRKLEEMKALPDNWKVTKGRIDIQELDKELVDLMIKKVVVNKDNTIEIIWNIK